MNLLSVVNSLRHIEGIVHDIIELYGNKADGLEDDATIVISTVQELRFAIEHELGI
jgi:hypothetical protein